MSDALSAERDAIKARMKAAKTSEEKRVAAQFVERLRHLDERLAAAEGGPPEPDNPQTSAV